MAAAIPAEVSIIPRFVLLNGARIIETSLRIRKSCHLTKNGSYQNFHDSSINEEANASHLQMFILCSQTFNPPEMSLPSG
jgi:hypothetical protein